MSSDPVGSIVWWLLGVMALAIILPFLLIGCAAVALSQGVVRVYQGGSVARFQRRELQRIAQERDAAIGDVVRLCNEGERELRRVAEQRAIERGRREWAE
jgi:hypothetical protein